MNDLLIRLRDLDFRYTHGDFRLKVSLLDVARGEHMAIVGVSGSGKTTLLNIVAGIHKAATGSVSVDDTELHSLSDAGRRQFRVTNIGLIFQSFELLEYLTVRDNILLPYRISPALKLSQAVAARAAELAENTGIANQLGSFPGQLSQGERQRTAICRALISEPLLILADEPTGNLDPDNKQKVLDTLLGQAERHGATLVMVTHDHELLARFDRSLDMRDLA
jgi:putative ABC transport system ATP-binding protein